MILIVSTVAGAGSVTAASGGGDGSDDVTHLGNQRVVISGGQATVDGVDVRVPGFPSIDINERTYGVDRATISADGVRVEWDGRTYQVGQINVVLKDISVTLRDITVN